MAFPTLTVTPGSGQTVNTLPTAGQATMANSLGVAIASDQSSIPVSFGTETITQTVVAAAAATSTLLIAANSTRKSLRWMNVGANPVTVAPGTGTVTVGSGMNYDPGPSSINQGGGTTFEGIPTPTNAFSCISTAGTTMIVWEGN